jgi:hypothetical protein
MTLAETYSEIQRNVKNEIRIRISTTWRSVSRAFTVSKIAGARIEKVRHTSGFVVL